MGEETAIEWTWRKDPKTGLVIPGYTFNFWMGCTEVAPECAGCYAKALDNKRFSKIPSMGGDPDAPVSHWGKGAPRHLTADAYWSKAKTWDRKAAKAYTVPPAVFTLSLGDFFDQEVPKEWRVDALQLIDECPHLDWLILTKRPEHMKRELTHARENVWTGTSIGCVKSLDKLEHLLATPSRLRFLSMEPLLEDVGRDPRLMEALATGEIHWVIVGGESESKDHPHKARPMHPDWILNIQKLCWAYNVPFFFKQWGEWAPAFALDHNPQLQAMCATGKVTRHDFGTGEGGRGTMFKVGKRQAGHNLDGKTVQEIPALRKLAA